ncbi:ABC transporter ATP-binding protein [Thermosulfuriphilus sp.]
MKNFFSVGPFSLEENGRLLYRHVYFSLPEGVFAVLTGPSGSGKSSLFRQIVGLSSAPRARRVLDDREYPPLELSSFRAEALFLAQGGPMISGTVLDNLTFAFGLKARGQRRFDKDRARELMRELGLAHISWQQRARDLSVGERHRLALVRALLWDPKVLLADEPFVGLDKESYSRALGLLFSQARRSRRLVFCILHEPVPSDCDLLFELKGGCLKRLK